MAVARIRSHYEQYLGRPPGCLGVSGPNRNWGAGGRTPGSPRAPRAPPRAPQRPHLHVRRLFPSQAHRVAAVRAQQRAERAHAVPAAATEELGHAVAMLWAAPAARVLRLGGARPSRGSAEGPRARHSLPLFGGAGAGGALLGNRNPTAGRGGARALDGPALGWKMAAGHDRGRGGGTVAASSPSRPAGCSPAPPAPAVLEGSGLV